MCLASHFVNIESWKLIVGYRDIYYAKKILNPFVCVEVTILVVKCNVYEGHMFTRPLLQTCRLETTFLCLNIRLIGNNNFQILIIFIEINVNVCLLCAHHVMEGIILHIVDLTVNKMSVTHLAFMFRWFSFRILRSWKARFSHRSISPRRYVLKSFRCLEVSNHVRNWNKVKNNIYVSWKFQLFQLEIPMYKNKLMCKSLLIISVSFVFCLFNCVVSWNEGKTINLVWSSFQIPK